MPRHRIKLLLSKIYPPSRFNSLLIVLFLLIALITAIYTLANYSFDTRSKAQTVPIRPNWLGLAGTTISRTNSLQITPWMYNWAANLNTLNEFGSSYTPMLWGCTANIDTVINWPVTYNYYVLFLNEPEIADQANCSPQTAAVYLRTLLTHPNRKPNMKVLIGGNAYGPTWIKQLLSTYKSSYGSYPDVAGIHFHIYPDLSGATSGTMLLDRSKSILSQWDTFSKDYSSFMNGKEKWITETGVLSGDLNDAITVDFMNKWMTYLNTRNDINRVFWFTTQTSTGTYDWQFRSSMLYRDGIATPLLPAFTSLCAKYCPMKPVITYPSSPSQSQPTISTTTQAVIRWFFPTNSTKTVQKYALRINDLSNGWTDTCTTVSPGDVCQDITGTSYTLNGTSGHSYAIWMSAQYTDGSWSNGSEGRYLKIAAAPTPTPTRTPTSTPTRTPTPIPPTPTRTPTKTPTRIPTSTPTRTPTPTPTRVPTLTPTKTPTLIPTNTPTRTPTATPTLSLINTPTRIPTTTFTPTQTPTRTPTPTPTNTPIPSCPRKGMGDITCDGFINAFDNTKLLQFYGTNNTSSDITGDGIINVFDFTVLLKNYGT